MGLRREPRARMRVPVRIFGTDRQGRTFSESAHTTDVSRSGVCLEGVKADLSLGETVGLTYQQNRARFQVKWTSEDAGARSVGLQNIAPEKALWDFALPPTAPDHYQRTSAAERRRHPRIRSLNSVEIQAESQSAPIWGKVSDLSQGGCFVEMPMPLRQGTLLKAGLWLGENKVWLKAKVASSRPGFGIGIEFVEIVPDDARRLQEFLRSITRSPW